MNDQNTKKVEGIQVVLGCNAEARDWNIGNSRSRMTVGIGRKVYSRTFDFLV